MPYTNTWLCLYCMLHLLNNIWGNIKQHCPLLCRLCSIVSHEVQMVKLHPMKLTYYYTPTRKDARRCREDGPLLVHLFIDGELVSVFSLGI